MAGTVAIIQARTGSARLPGKALARVLQRPLLDLLLERVERAHSVDEIVVATTRLAPDDELERIATSRGLECFRGSEHDVLSRYLGAARRVSAEVLVRLTADCPLLDPAVIDHVIARHRASQTDADLVTNAPPRGRSYPDGMDVEVITMGVLERLDALAKEPADREHVTSRLHAAPFHCEVVHLEPPAGDVRVTVDDAEDLARVRAIFEALYPRNAAFGLPEVLSWIGASGQESSP